MATDKNKHGGVGSDPEAIKDIGGKGDFGIPARDSIVRAHDGEIEGRPAGSAPGYSGDAGARTTGVGSRGGAPGRDSGGDLDTDIIGFDGHGGLAATSPDDELTEANTNRGPSKTFASGGPAAGRNGLRPHSHGSSPSFKGDTVDHSGEDQSTNPTGGEGGGVNALRGSDPGAEGEINLDEATGDVENGGEQ